MFGFHTKMKILILILPLLTPVIVSILYAPINQQWTVNIFGCGCPPLDLSFRFNANHFNMILWSIVAASCISVWIWQVCRQFKHKSQNWRLSLIAIGVIIVFFTCIRALALGFWL